MGLTSLFYPWGWMLQAAAFIHFARRRPDTYWLWIILFGGGLGAAVYILVEVVPDVDLLRGSFTTYSRRRRLRELEAIVIENPAVGNQEELADLYLEDGQFARARDRYNTVIAQSSGSLDPFYRRALAAIALDDVAAALPDLERVVTKDPKYDFHRAIGLMGHVYGRTGHPEQAEEMFKRATDISTLSETYYNYAVWLGDEKRIAEARDWAGRILSRNQALPRYLRRRERPWFRKAAALLKRLPPG